MCDVMAWYCKDCGKHRLAFRTAPPMRPESKQATEPSRRGWIPFAIPHMSLPRRATQNAECNPTATHRLVPAQPSPVSPARHHLVDAGKQTAAAVIYPLLLAIGLVANGMGFPRFSTEPRATFGLACCPRRPIFTAAVSPAYLRTKPDPTVAD
jgi:hypothetical protein